ncbi:hypothetical protein OIDMADRAFT_59440 [Oidiodendron maius Zn]|uniref:BZIP domain-containing protein n=1 Tax=Oidiodendron maius (strain Zn) TaxID=913774 RepID=A0A0C3GZJ9_OIDMZ|nr:hypothetical protein OIDMADRAFT_59440 [Oidiodendron maius Zn]
MTTQTTVLRRSRQLSLLSKMVLPVDKEERKREYNRLAQREFRRRRKEHLKSLEQAKKEQSAEKLEEIEYLRYENDTLRRENEILKSQMYNSSASSSHILPTPRSVPSISEDNRAYSLSPSILVASISRTASPTATLESDTIGLSLSSSMLHPTMALYSDPPTLSDQQYSIALQSGVRSNPQYLAEPSESMITIPYYRTKARAEIMKIFRPLLSGPSTIASPDSRLAVLETYHYYGVDLIPSISLREPLLTTSPTAAQGSVMEVGLIGGDCEDINYLIVWSDSVPLTSQR